MKRAQAVQQAAELLWTAEEAVFTALRDVSVLTAGLIDIRRASGLSAVTGQDALNHIADTTAALHAGRSGIVAAHAELAEVKGRIGAGRVQLNGGMDKADQNASAVDFARIDKVQPLRMAG